MGGGGLVLNRQRRRERQAVTAQKRINDLCATAPQHVIGESPLKSAHDILGGQSVRRTPDSFGSACWRLGGLASGLALVIGEWANSLTGARSVCSRFTAAALPFCPIERPQITV